MATSVWNLPTPTRKEETRTFTDPGTGWEISLSLREPDVLMQADIQDYAEERLEFWGGKDGKGKPRRYMPPGEKAGIIIPHSLISMLAALERLQPGPERVPFEELLGISIKLPELWSEILAWAVTYLPSASDNSEEPAGNSLRAEGALSSAPPSSADNAIPTSTPTPPPVCGVSTPDSEPCAPEPVASEPG